jgi:putative peptidoglycan lipid II flippase
MVPIGAVLAVLAGPLVRLLLGHGAAGGAGAALTGQVLAVLALGLPGFSAYLYFVRVYQALQELGPAFRLYLLNNGLMVALAAVLYRPFGVQGIAAAVAASYTAAAVAAGALVRRRLGPAAPGEPRMLPGPVLVRACAAGLASGAVVWSAVRWVGAPTGVGALSPLLAGAVVVAGVAPQLWAWRHWVRPPGLTPCGADGSADPPGTGRDSARRPRARAR